jgi:hypothetical protein
MKSRGRERERGRGRWLSPDPCCLLPTTYSSEQTRRTRRHEDTETAESQPHAEGTLSACKPALLPGTVCVGGATPSPGPEGPTSPFKGEGLRSRACRCRAPGSRFPVPGYAVSALLLRVPGSRFPVPLLAFPGYWLLATSGTAYRNAAAGFPEYWSARRSFRCGR